MELIITSLGLGVGLAMDAFAVSLANGLNEKCLKPAKVCGIAGVFGIFQGIMPLIGWVCVHTILEYFGVLEKFIPWIALILLCYIGGKMLLDGIKNKTEGDVECKGLTFGTLIVQGIATSIDALSVGFTIASRGFVEALISVAIIAVVTFIICVIGLVIGKMAGTHLAGKASILGGVILIILGLEIFITSFL